MATQTKKIAVVDDNRLSRDMVVAALGSLPWTQVDSYADGETAWKALEKGKSPDIVLTDVDMPRMNGLELLQRVKTKNPDKPCIVMSGSGSYKKAAHDLHADGFLSKPFELTDLFEVMGQFA